MSSAMPVPFSGGCACGRIRYQSSAAPLHMFNCHCRDCQYASGSGYTAALLVPVTGFSLLSGEPRYFSRNHDDGRTIERGFCPDCGTPLFARLSRRPDLIGIRAGSLDDPSWFAPQVDFWTSSAQPWDSMDPRLPKLEQQAPPSARRNPG